MEPLIAEIKLFAGNFPPRGYAFCDGQLMPINSNDALFSLIGTTYGGDGRTNFALPDLRGRAPIHAGHAPNLPNVSQGQQSGNTAVGKGTDTQTTPTLAVRYIIALQGMFPSRS